MDALALLRILADEALTGAALQQKAGLEPGDFMRVARQLWRDGLVQGVLTVGCCSAPCGLMCVSALKMEAVWQLSKKGRLRLKVLDARA